MDHVQKLCYFARGYGKVEFKDEDKRQQKLRILYHQRISE